MSEKSQSKKKTTTPGLKTAGPMDVALLERIVKLMEANDLNMVDLRDGERRVLMRRGPAAPVAMPIQIAAPVGGVAPPPQSAGNGVVEEKLHEIKSPMVGTFYSAPSPDAKPFVTVGSVVSEETDVCVIEAMKVFNNVKAECKGTIARILVNNGQAVEFNQVLFLVRP
ncbi:MAG: acetyl-CoA carboxylase biotin carboxyl carrier protein [Tepidisphaeraceae bacterium]